MRNNIIDYIYYFFQKTYNKIDKQDSFTSLCAVSLFEVSTIFFIIIITIRFLFEKNKIAYFSKEISYSGVLLFVILVYVNHKIYKNQFALLEEKWGQESRSKKLLKGIGVILLVTIPFFFLILLGIA